MDTMIASSASAARSLVGECPVWSAPRTAWYWVDIVAKKIWRLTRPAARCAAGHAEMVACIAPARDGGMIAGMETGIFACAGRRRQRGAERLAAPRALTPGHALQRRPLRPPGRFWSGTMFMDMAAARPTAAVPLRCGGEACRSRGVGLLTQNGLAFSPDGRTMYLSDSHPARQQVWAFDYDTDEGVPSTRRLFVDMRRHPGRPDGATVDTDGCYWTCGNDAAACCASRRTGSSTARSSCRWPSRRCAASAAPAWTPCW
jgi:sugar lactone lactonase YvrE